MKRILIATLVSLASFAAGLVGVYFALPSLAPDRVTSARLQLDSLNVQNMDSTVVTDSSGFSSPDSALVSAGSLSKSDPTTLSSLEEEAPAGKRTSLILSDTLKYLAESLQTTRSENAVLREQIDEFQKQIKSLQANRIEAGNLSETLTKLEDKELRAVVQQLDMETVTMLYQQASARNRTRLLQAMPAERAALFVRSLIQSGEKTQNASGWQPGDNEKEVSPDETS